MVNPEQVDESKEPLEEAARKVIEALVLIYLLKELIPTRAIERIFGK
jgi:hypothetical protein